MICQTTNVELAQIKAMYPGLEKEVEKETSGNYRKVLLELLKCKRDESLVVNEREAEADADTFYRAGEKKLGTDDSTFIKIITSRSLAHLAAMDRYGGFSFVSSPFKVTNNSHYYASNFAYHNIII